MSGGGSGGSANGNAQAAMAKAQANLQQASTALTQAQSRLDDITAKVRQLNGHCSTLSGAIGKAKPLMNQQTISSKSADQALGEWQSNAGQAEGLCGASGHLQQWGAQLIACSARQLQAAQSAFNAAKGQMNSALLQAGKTPIGAGHMMRPGM